MSNSKKIRRLLVANRSEIAVRIFRTCAELGIHTITVYASEDPSLHRLKADESFQIGNPGDSVGAYLPIEAIIRAAKSSGADAIHPGYGFLAESPELADACVTENIVFVGPRGDTMRDLGDKISARRIAESVGVPVAINRSLFFREQLSDVRSGPTLTRALVERGPDLSRPQRKRKLQRGPRTRPGRARKKAAVRNFLHAGVRILKFRSVMVDSRERRDRRARRL